MATCQVYQRINGVETYAPTQQQTPPSSIAARPENLDATAKLSIN